MYVRFIIHTHTHTHTRGQTDTDRQQARSNDSLDRLVDRQMTQKEGSIDRLFVPVRYVLYRKESMGKLRRYISSSSSLPSCPSSFLLLWVLCVVLFLCHAQEEQVTVCNGPGNETCAARRQICLRTISSGTTTVPKQSCGTCLPGYIEWPPSPPSSSFSGSTTFSSTNCTWIPDLSLADYVNAFQPSHYITSNTNSNSNTSLDAERLAALYENLWTISEWNAQIPPPTFQLSVTKFSADLTAERQARHGFSLANHNASIEQFDRFVNPYDPNNSNNNNRHLATTAPLPLAIDWVERGMVTSVKDQEQCGCCWAMAGIASIESAAAIHNPGFLDSLSSQQMISCDTFNYGCNGGNVAAGLAYAWKNKFGGVTSDAAYPFVDQNGYTSACNLQGKQLTVAINNPVIVVAYSDTEEDPYYTIADDPSLYHFSSRMSALKAATAQQPVAVTIHSDCALLNNYGGGVLTVDTGCACADTSCMDHSVLLVGYNDSHNPPYWKLKNSWGTSWGESGYFRVSQENNGNPWGLFGLLGEGVMPLQAVNTTAPLPDPSQGSQTLGNIDNGITNLLHNMNTKSLRGILLIAMVVLFLLGCCLSIFQECRRCSK